MINFFKIFIILLSLFSVEAGFCLNTVQTKINNNFSVNFSLNNFFERWFIKKLDPQYLEVVKRNNDAKNKKSIFEFKALKNGKTSIYFEKYNTADIIPRKIGEEEYRIIIYKGKIKKPLKKDNAEKQNNILKNKIDEFETQPSVSKKNIEKTSIKNIDLSNTIIENNKLLLGISDTQIIASERVKELIKFAEELFKRKLSAAARKEYYNLLSEAIPQFVEERIYYRIAQTFYQDKNFDEAIKNFKLVISNFEKPDLNDEAQFFIGLCYYKKKDFENALIELLRLKITYPNSPFIDDALYYIALIYLEQKDYANALNELKNLTKLKNSNFIQNAYYKIAYIYDFIPEYRNFYKAYYNYTAAGKFNKDKTIKENSIKRAQWIKKIYLNEGP